MSGAPPPTGAGSRLTEWSTAIETSLVIVVALVVLRSVLYPWSFLVAAGAGAGLVARAFRAGVEADERRVIVFGVLRRRELSRSDASHYRWESGFPFGKLLVLEPCGERVWSQRFRHRNVDTGRADAWLAAHGLVADP